MASVQATAPQTFTSFTTAKRAPAPSHQRAALNFHAPKLPERSFFSRNGRKSNWALNSAVEELDAIPVQSADFTDQQEGVAVGRAERDGVEGELGNAVGGFSELSLGGAGEIQGFSSSASVGDDGGTESGEMERVMIDRIINATIVLAAGSYAFTKLLTINQDYWHGWTLYERNAYEEALKTHPVLAKMVISGVVYSLGDWIAQCFEGKPLFEFDRRRMFRSSLVGFSLHGSLSHYYYHFCEGLESQHSFLQQSCISAFEHGKREIGKLVAIILICIQISSPLPLLNWNFQFIHPAMAVLYSPDTKVPRTGELALRRAIPANTSMKTIQDSLEEISYLLRIPQRKPYGTMEGNVKKALKLAVDEKDLILGSIPSELKEKGSLLYTTLIEGKGGLQTLLQSIRDNDPDKVSVGLASSLDTVAELELLQAPGLSFLLPEQYLKYPRLTGRGTVEFTIEKGDGSAFSPQAGGESSNTATIQVVVDGFSTPLTAGNFAKLVIDGAYDGTKLSSTSQAVLSENSPDQNKGYSIPLEIKPSGQFEPLYRTTLSVQDGELPVLPLSVYGAVAMAHNEDSEEYSSPYQFFFYLYDKRNSGLGGLSFDEGQFSVFGYTTVGRDILPHIKTGDIIRSAKLVEGQDRLILPNEN